LDLSGNLRSSRNFCCLEEVRGASGDSDRYETLDENSQRTPAMLQMASSSFVACHLWLILTASNKLPTAPCLRSSS
jgi:hypothetical protein